MFLYLKKKLLNYFTIFVITLLIIILLFDYNLIFNINCINILAIINIIIILLNIFILFNKNETKFYKLIIYISLLSLIIPFIMMFIQFFNVTNFEKNLLKILFDYKNSLITSIIFYLLIRYIFFIKKLYKIIDNPYFIFIISFVILSIIGTALLILPKSTINGISFINALFTSTSAVCVTGLVVVDINQNFTFLGKIIIMILIELGGLGILTITSCFSYFFNKETSFKEGLYMSDVINSSSLSNVMKLAVKIVIFTLLIQLIGAIMIYYSILGTNLGENSPLFFSIFHAVSAFCNAGFSIISNGGLYSPLLRYNYTLHFVIALLLIIGGIGFNIIFSFYNYIINNIKRFFYKIFKNEFLKFNPKIINLNIQISYITTIFLLFIGTIFYYIFEYDNSLKEHNTFLGKWIAAFFSSATSRTAGFQVIDLNLLSTSSILFTIILMWIGACPGSTGGGIKTNTFALSILNIICISRGKNYIEIQGKQISSLSIYRSFAIITLSLIVIFLSIFLIIELDPKQNILKISFETFSAFSTVGLSLGITDKLNNSSKIILIILMLIGRIGTLNFMLGIMKKIKPKHYRYPEEIILN